MERALTFAGYEVDHAWGDGGHNARARHRRSSPTPCAGSGRTGPTPIKAGAGSPQLQEILIPGEDWELVGDGYRFTEGPAANAEGEVFFNDIPNREDLQGRPRRHGERVPRRLEGGQRPGVRPRRPALRRRRRHRAGPRLRRRRRRRR